MGKERTRGAVRGQKLKSGFSKSMWTGVTLKGNLGRKAWTIKVSWQRSLWKTVASVWARSQGCDGVTEVAVGH